MSENHPTEPTGMSAYEELVNNISDSSLLDAAVQKISACDQTGQFAASGARFLAALDPEEYAPQIDALLKLAIDRDREKAYLPDLLSSIWGPDYSMRLEELRESDDNFRRIYKRVHPSSVI